MIILCKYWFYRLTVLLTVIFLITGQSLFSQDLKKDSGNVQILQDDRVDQVVQKHVRINESLNGIEGYRIQIFFDSGSNSKTRARSIYETFLTKYPDVGAYLSFKSPNYKVRVGDFRTKLDAQRFLNEILPEYPNAWIIEDQINLPNVEP